MRWLGLCAVVLCTAVLADRGMVPVEPRIRVFEPEQNAVIAFNGEEELLYLTTGVRASGRTAAIQLVPFPTKPEVSKGEIGVLRAIERFLWRRIVRRRHWKAAQNAAGRFRNAVQVLQQQRIGSHNLIIIKADEKEAMLRWLKRRLGGRIANRAWFRRLRDIINHYHACGFRYWVLDEVQLTPNTRFVEPLVYRFRCPFMYYPLVVSSLLEGETTITVAAFSADAAPFVKTMPKGFRNLLLLPNGKRGVLTLSSDQLKSIWSDAADLFGSGETVELCIYRYKGDVKFESDIPETVGMRRRVAELFERLAKVSSDAEPEVAWVLADLAEDYLFAAPDKAHLLKQMRKRCQKAPEKAKPQVVAAIKRALGYILCGLKDFGLKTLRGVSARSMPKHYLAAVKFLLTALKNF